MKRRPHRITASVIGLSAAITVIVCIALLVAGYVNVLRHALGDEARADRLVQLANKDPAQIPAMEAELKRQTEASLEREAKTAALANVLIVAATLFLISAKWLIALSDRRPPRLDKILAQRATRKGLRAPPGRTIASPPPEEVHESHAPRAPADMMPPAETPAAPADLKFVDDIIGEHGCNRATVIPILQAIQSHDGYLSHAALQRVCELTEITPAQIAGVSSFYRHFRHSPAGRHIVKVCHGTACHVAGAQAISDEIRRCLGIEPDVDTDPQRQFTIEEAACLGCCTLAPVAQIDEVTCGHLTPDMVPGVLDDCLAAQKSGDTRHREAHAAETDVAGTAPGEIRIGLGSCCVAGGSGKVYEALERAVSATGVRVTIKRVGCVGMCHRTPLVETVVPGQPTSLYAAVGPEDAKAIVRRHFRPDRIGKRITNTVSTMLDGVLQDGQRQSIVRRAIEVRDPSVSAFLDRQKHIATEHCGHIDPVDLDEYLRHDGFKALDRCVKGLTPPEVIEEIRRSGLRGRGGAGYSTALKWSKVRDAANGDKYVVCNGDEGDPGAFMDRMLMESFPYRIVEGMAIAAYAVGAGKGYFYIRAEYPLAVKRIRDALCHCEDRGLLGDDFLGTGATLRLRIMEGAGGFVCGEETALLASIEGNRGSPRLRPPYPAESGLWGKPTLVGNVETYATVPWIIRNGAEAFAALGTATSKGTKVFALTGKIKRGGLIEVPMGVTIREIVDLIGGGIKDARRFKAVQIGGPSGGCIPENLADTPVDFEALTGVGAIMGSGGLVVLDESDCMVDIARYFLTFTQDQSCGKCTYCRIGTRRMLDILDRLCEGDGRKGDLETLEQLAHAVKAGSLCGLGQTAPKPVLSTLRYFRDEYEAHLGGRCPAGKCKALITYRVTDHCIGCTLCAQHCPAEAIDYTPYERHKIDVDRCTRCGTCRARCPENAVEVV